MPKNYTFPESECNVSSRVRHFLNYLLTNKIESANIYLIVTHQVVCNQILKVATKKKNENIKSSYNYPKGGLTLVFDKDEWLFEPINWEKNE
jgi:broad specificity phosphatase PhoE